MEKQEINHIISKSLTGELSEKEQTALDKWASESVENKKELEAFTQLWEKSKDLVVSDSIDVEKSLLKTKKRISGLKKVRVLSSFIRQAAAVLILAVSLSVLYNYFIAGNNSIEIPEQIVYQEIKASYGTQTKVILADGTNVWLNSGSTLKFPATFNNSSEREVDLNGEGYFEVSKNELKPFVVRTSKLDVRVLGTSFNVSAYNEYNSMTVALVEGKISLEKEYGGEKKELVTLEPDELIEYDQITKKLYHSSSLNIERYTAWKEGQIVFFDDHIDVVVKRLEKWYNVKIHVNGEALKNYSFTATFIDESLEQVLKLLSLSSPMNYKIIPAQKQNDNSYSKREITLSKKNEITEY